VYEDDAILALNKPVGISVMGERHDTDLVDLAKDAGEELFPVHRIDKVTSGLILFARDLAAHGGLTRQFNKQTVDKAYLMITRTADLPAEGVVDLPLSAGRKGRIRIAAPRESIVESGGRWSVDPADVLDTRVYPSTTEFTTVWTDGELSLLAVRPISGRRHQIRVHMAWIGHPILGDPLFDKASDTRTYLHSWRLAVDAEWAGTRLRLVAEPGPDFWAPVKGRVDPATLLVD
jgi:tRNA pseudouridine32 synthase/23S rRNA pseudouridine746 synthase/23S rRNA pseudouridine1911/1915/1917 synthase